MGIHESYSKREHEQRKKAAERRRKRRLSIRGNAGQGYDNALASKQEGGVTWECKSDQGWQEYEEYVVDKLEAAYRNGKSAVEFDTRYKIKGSLGTQVWSKLTRYSIDWINYEQVNFKNHVRRKIRRCVDGIPVEWDEELGGGEEEEEEQQQEEKEEAVEEEEPVPSPPPPPLQLSDKE
mmetsp:Transcript_47532/g.131750  ORF Transcript_47532/g.131750 Transcript_47532/m.131750 type:complete len:179 (+) Transcript_47532:85-621(+)